MIGSKRIAILGSTGSIGKSTISVAQAHQERIRVVGLSAGQNVEILSEQIIACRPECVAIVDEAGAEHLRARFKGLTVFSGIDSATELIQEVRADLVVAAISGMAGLSPIVAAIRRGMDIALANKEALVSAGTLLMDEVRSRGVQLLPIDSEHSALWQALHGSSISQVKKLILTASGGPFFGMSRAELKTVTWEQALRHPTWRMGGKISIDSATLMNKGLEVIETHHLFGVGYQAIEVLVHPQSIVHSLVEFVDGSQLAQCSMPDMRIPIQLAISFPERWPASWVSNEHSGSAWTFFSPDTKTFRCLGLAIEAGRRGGAYPTVLNAANEVAVNGYLLGQISFHDIEYVVQAALDMGFSGRFSTFEDVYAADRYAREVAKDCVRSKAVK